MDRPLNEAQAVGPAFAEYLATQWRDGVSDLQINSMRPAPTAFAAISAGIPTAPFPKIAM